MLIGAPPRPKKLARIPQMGLSRMAERHKMRTGQQRVGGGGRTKLDGSMRRCLHAFGTRCDKGLNVKVSRNDVAPDNKCENSARCGRMKSAK